MARPGRLVEAETAEKPERSRASSRDATRARSVPKESERALDSLFGAYSYRRTGVHFAEYALTAERRCKSGSERHPRHSHVGLASNKPNFNAHATFLHCRRPIAAMDNPVRRNDRVARLHDRTVKALRTKFVRHDTRIECALRKIPEVPLFAFAQWHACESRISPRPLIVDR